MKKLLISGVAAVGLLITTAACSQASDEAGSDGLTGEWWIKSLEVGTEGDLTITLYSSIDFFTDETTAVQAMNPDTSAPDTPLTVQGYEAYFGDLTTDADAGTLTVTVESAAERDLIGQTFERNYEVDGDTLVLTPSDPAEGFRVTYERQSAS